MIRSAPVSTTGVAEADVGAVVGLMRLWGWRVIVPRNGATHGEPRTYGQGCRCLLCREASRLYQQDRRRARGIPPKKRRKFQILDFDDPIYQVPPHERDHGVRVDFTPTGKPVVHGKAGSYQRHGCRCLKCRRANSEASREWRARIKGTGPQEVKPYTPPKHGTRRGYGLGCSCDPCMEANRAYAGGAYHLYKDGISLVSDLDEYIFG